jgi:5-methylcytosine-specific restriction protein A
MPKRMAYFSPKRVRIREGRPSAHARGYGGKEWEAIRKRILIRDNFQCNYCGRVCGGPKEAHVDHIIPKRISGNNNEAGLHVLCAKCHSKKTQSERRSPGVT